MIPPHVQAQIDAGFAAAELTLARADLLTVLVLRALVTDTEHSGYCVGCGCKFWFHDLTTRFACSFLCLRCADWIATEIEAL